MLDQLGFHVYDIDAKVIHRHASADTVQRPSFGKVFIGPRLIYFFWSKQPQIISFSPFLLIIVSSATVTKAEPKATIAEPKATFLSHKRSDSHTHGVSEHFGTRSTALNYDQRVGHTNGAETPL